MGVLQPSLFKWLRLCESFVSSQMAANQVFQGAGCFARLVFFFGIMLQERVVKAPLVVTNHMRFGSQFPDVAGHFVRLAGLCQSQKSRQKHGSCSCRNYFQTFWSESLSNLTAVLFSICARRIHDTHWLNPSPMDPRQPHQTPSLISLSQGKFKWLELRRFLAHLPAHLQILRPLAICLLLLNSCIYIYIYM